MPIEGQNLPNPVVAHDSALPMSLADTADIATPVFSLDDSDSNDSVHQFLGHLQNPLALGRRGSHEDEEDDDGLLMDAVSGSPHGAVRTRPPSPHCPITFRASVSSPVSTAADQRHSHIKRRPWSQRANPAIPDQFGPSAAPSDDDEDEAKEDQQQQEAAAKRRRMARQLSPQPQPLGDASNRTVVLGRCMSEQCGLESGVRRRSATMDAVAMDTARIDKAIASIDSLNLIGNSEQGHALPTVKELDFGIRYVTPGTVSRLLAGHFRDRVGDYAIVDCRYPFEYRGGHISGAVNLYRPEELLDRMLGQVGCGQPIPDQVIIFHCEFSSERAPRMARALRQRDREMNSHNYPQLHYPELYLLHGGYKAFYEAHKADCNPSAYTRMSDPEHKEELAHFHRLGRAWERQASRSKHSRLQRMAGSPQHM